MVRRCTQSSLPLLVLLATIQGGYCTPVHAESSGTASWVKPIAATLFAGASAVWLKNASNHKPLYWDWDSIDTKDTQFPADFCWGSSTSSQQIEGSQVDNSWHLWERYKEKVGDSDFVPAGQACDFWNDHHFFIDMLKKARLTSFRMSLEWARIEPQDGHFNQVALDRYKQICKDFHDAGIKLFVTLHHYTEPIWFADTDYDHGADIQPGLGGFTKLENAHRFARYAAKAVEELNPYVHKWATFNNLTSYASKAYHAGLLPPGKKDMQLWQQTQANMLDAHVQAHRAIKDVCPDAEVGILHNVFHLEPARPWHPLDRLAVHMGNTLTRDGVYTFFKTGRYKVWIPTKVSVDHCNADAPGSLDWVGCNNYSHGWMHTFKVSRTPGETPIDNQLYTVYPEGMYRAIREVSENIAKPCGDIPIYVTENGVSTSDESVRKQFFGRYLYAIYKARQDGCKVAGYLPWTLVDNYEWGSDKSKSYGLYDQSRSLRLGVSPFLETVKKSLMRRSEQVTTV